MVMLMTGNDWGSKKEIEEKRVNKGRQGRCGRGATQDKMKKQRKRELRRGEEGGKVELLSHAKWKMGKSKLRGFMIQHVRFYEGAVLPSALPPTPLTF